MNYTIIPKFDIFHLFMEYTKISTLVYTTGERHADEKFAGEQDYFICLNKMSSE